MNDARFWALIAEVRAGSRNDDAFIVGLTKRLVALPPADIQAFNELCHTKLIDLYRWDIWGIAYIVNGGCSDDGFEYFRRWIIAQGKSTFDSICSDPDETFTDSSVTDCFLEELTSAIDKAYEQKAKKKMPPNTIRLPSQPDGDSWDEDELEELFPHTFAVYASED